MAGEEFWWLNRDTPEDLILMSIVAVAKKLFRLPKRAEMVEAREETAMRTSPVYFGSFEEALKKVAKLLYGHEMLTSPTDLLPSEKELPESEQEAIIEQRRQYYQGMLQKLSEPGALNRMRREKEEERRRRQYEKDTEGYIVRKIPIQTRQEMREVVTSAQPQCRGPFVSKKSTRSERSRTRRERWGYSPPNKTSALIQDSLVLTQSAQSSKMAEHVQSLQKSVTPEIVAPMQKPAVSKVALPERKTEHVEPLHPKFKSEVPKVLQMDRQNVSPIQKEDVKMSRSRLTREELLEILVDMRQYYGAIPTRQQVTEFARLHEDRRCPIWNTFYNHFGPTRTWQSQIEEYLRKKRSQDSSDEVESATSSVGENSGGGATLLKESQVSEQIIPADDDLTVRDGLSEGHNSEVMAAYADLVLQEEAEGNESQFGLPLSSAASEETRSVQLAPVLDSSAVKLDSPENLLDDKPVSTFDDAALELEKGEESQDAGVPRPESVEEVRKFKINLFSVVLKFSMEDQDYEVELEFGK